MPAQTAKESMQESIDALALDGVASTIYLDPIAMRVYDFPANQNAVPMAVHNRIDVSIITVADGASDTSVKVALHNAVDKIVDYAACFSAISANGKGVWRDDIDYAEYNFYEITAEIAYASDPSDGFEGEKPQIIRKYMLGMSYDDILSTYDLGDEINGWCAESDALDYIENTIVYNFTDGSNPMSWYDDGSTLTLHIDGNDAHLHLDYGDTPDKALGDLDNEFDYLVTICTLGDWTPHDDGGMMAKLIPIAL